MAQTQSTATSQESQTNIYPNSDQIALWQQMLATEGGLANWLVNNNAPQATVAGPTGLTNQLWNQAASTTQAPDVSGNAGQMTNLAGWMNQEMAPTSFNIAPGQLNFTNPFAGGTPQIGATAADYQYNPQQVSGPTVAAQQVSAPGSVTPISGIAQINAPTMSPVQQVNAPNLSQFTMQAAPNISANQITAPQSWTSPGTAQQYMDPYTQQAVNAQLQQAQVQNAQQINAIQGQAAQQGAFGGSREAIEEANQNLGYQQLASTIEAQGLQSAYQQGMGQFTAEQQMSQAQQQANQQAGLQAAMSNQQMQQQAAVQNLSSFLQTQGLGAQTGLQSQLANQQMGYNVGALNAQMNMQGQLANQSTGLQTALYNQQGQEFGLGQQMQASLANQQANLQAAQATAGYNMQGQLANQASGLQAGLAAEQMGLQGAEANQAAQMQAMLTQYQGGLQGALQTQNLGMQGQIYNAQLGLAGNQQNLNNLAEQANLWNQAGGLNLAGFQAGLSGLGALGTVAQGQQGYQQQLADTAYQNQMNQLMLPFQAMGAWAGMAAESPSWGQTTTATNYGQGQTDQPTFNLGQIVGGIIQGGAQVGAAAAGAAKGGLMSLAEDGTPRFGSGGIASYAEGGDAEDDDDDSNEIRTPDINFLSGTAKPGPWTTRLSPLDEMRFQGWLKSNNIPFQDSPTADYDMRGFWQAQQQGDPVAKTAVSTFDHRIHFPDVWKTPYHRSFSNESKYATPNAPRWSGDDESGYALRDKLGNVVYDERIKHADGGLAGLAAEAEKASQFRRKLYGALRQHHHNYPAARKSPQRFLDEVLSPESTGLGNLAYA